jgi:hypothetical protein
MVNHVPSCGMYRCPVCKKGLKRMGEATIYDGLPKEISKDFDYYYCDNCHKNMNRCCFIFFQGTIYVYSDHKKWEELRFNPSIRNGVNYESFK